ncbi:MAG TPA: hypothetical protein DEB06_11780, partial [Phycisphaerales bacterium]|nr:hypothetical protein [Phycisphaerales bacterium]
MTLRRFSAAISAPLHGLALMLAALLGGVSASRAADPVPPPSVALEADPAIVRRTLANGLQVVVLPNANPPGQALVRLVVSAGSRSEAPSEVGASYLAARLLLARARETPAGARAASIPGVFNPPQESDPIVQSNSDLASVTLAVPTADASDLAAVFSFLAEFLRVGALDADTVTRLRPQVQADAAQSESKSDRLRRVVAPVLAPGTTLTTNPSFPRVDRLCEVESDTVTRFVERCYAPIAATLFVVGDADPAAVAALAERELTPVPSTPAEPPARLTLSPRTQPGVVVVSDPDASSFYAELIVPTPAIGALRTAADLRRQLTMELLGIVLDRRMSALLGEREPAVLEVNAWSGDVSSSMFVSVATAVGNAPNWAAIGARVVGVARTLAQGGVTPEERSVAADSLLSRLARDASGVVPSGRLLKSLTRAETLGGLALAPVQLEAAARRVVPAISADDLSRAAAERCDPSIGTLVLVFPPAVPTPSESEARALFAAPLVSPAPAQPRVLPVAHEEPDKPGPDAQGLPGGVAEVTVSPETGVTSAWLTNGIRLHYREVRGTSAGASVAISLVGGRSLEDEGTRGLTLASAALWSTPAFVGTAASGVRKSMTDLSLRLSYLIEPDRVLLEFGVGGESLEAALSLMANLLDQPVIESQSFERWSTSEQRRSQALARSSTGVITTRLEQMLFRPDDPRFGSLSAQESSALKLPNAQAWVEQLCGGPIEIGIAGELRSSVALEIVAR